MQHSVDKDAGNEAIQPIEGVQVPGSSSDMRASFVDTVCQTRKIGSHSEYESDKALPVDAVPISVAPVWVVEAWYIDLTAFDKPIVRG